VTTIHEKLKEAKTSRLWGHSSAATSSSSASSSNGQKKSGGIMGSVVKTFRK
jgi:hypothetical protein